MISRRIATTGKMSRYAYVCSLMRELFSVHRDLGRPDSAGEPSGREVTAIDSSPTYPRACRLPNRGCCYPDEMRALPRGARMLYEDLTEIKDQRAHLQVGPASPRP